MEEKDLKQELERIKQELEELKKKLSVEEGKSVKELPQEAVRKLMETASEGGQNRHGDSGESLCGGKGCRCWCN